MKDFAELYRKLDETTSTNRKIMDESQRFVWNKLITGGFRVGVSRRLVVRALERFSGIDAAVITHRLMGEWPATADTYRRILSPDTRDTDISRPYPFYLAYPLADKLVDLGPINYWQVEWKWDGIRGQMIKRRSQVFIWSRGEELVTEKYPELADSTAFLPDGTVLDGEILPWRDGRPLPFSELQRRIGRKTVDKKLLKEVPTAFLVYDVLEFDAEDLRQKPLLQHRKILSQMLSNLPANRIIPSPVVAAQTWQELEILHEESSRHKSGVAVRFQRIVRWRRDKKIEENESYLILPQLKILFFLENAIKWSHA